VKWPFDFQGALKVIVFRTGLPMRQISFTDSGMDGKAVRRLLLRRIVTQPSGMVWNDSKGQFIA